MILKTTMSLVVVLLITVESVQSQPPRSFEPTQEEIEQIKKNANEMFIQRRYEKNVRNNRNIEAIVRLIADDEFKDSKFVSSLGLTEEQLKDISNIFDDFNSNLVAVDSSKHNPKKYGTFENQVSAMKSGLKQQLLDDVNDVFLPHQMNHVARMDVTKSGLPKLLTQTPIGDFLELTDGQKRRIEAKSEELAIKIEKFIHESRQEAYDLVFDQLEVDQKEKLFKLYDEWLIKRLISTSPLHLIYGHYVFELPEDFDHRLSPAFRVTASEIKEEKDK